MDGPLQLQFAVLPLVREWLEEALAAAMKDCTDCSEAERRKYQRRLKALCTAIYDDVARETTVNVPVKRSKREPCSVFRVPESQSPTDPALLDQRDAAAKQLASELTRVRCSEWSVSQKWAQSLQDCGDAEELVLDEKTPQDVLKTTVESIKFLGFERDAKQAVLAKLQSGQAVPRVPMKQTSLSDLQVRGYLYQPSYFN